MDIDMTDQTGKLRDTQEFRAARRIVERRLVSGIPQDIELFMQFTVIIEALRIAEIISSSAANVTPNAEVTGAPLAARPVD